MTMPPFSFGSRYEKNKYDLSLQCEGRNGNPRLDQCVSCIHLLIASRRDPVRQQVSVLNELEERFKIKPDAPSGIPLYCKKFFKNVPLVPELINKIMGG